MSRFYRVLFAAMAAVLASSCAVTDYATDPDAPKSGRSATLTVKTTQAAHWASGQNGKGTLRYRGRSYPFKVSAIGVGGNGVQDVTYKGDVYNLNKLSDFAGYYNGVRSGITLGEGKVRQRLTGENGVIIYLKGDSKGVANSNGRDRFLIEME